MTSILDHQPPKIWSSCQTKSPVLQVCSQYANRARHSASVRPASCRPKKHQLMIPPLPATPSFCWNVQGSCHLACGSSTDLLHLNEYPTHTHTREREREREREQEPSLCPFSKAFIIQFCGKSLLQPKVQRL